MIITLACFLIPLLCAALELKLYRDTGSLNLPAAVFALAFPALFYKPMERLREKCIRETEYDENGSSIRNQSLEKLSRKERDAIERQKLMDMELVLSSSTLRAMTRRGSSHPEEDLENLTGCPEVKKKILEMASRMAFDQKVPGKTPVFPHHMAFLGNPGTGKTTAARIMTAFLYRSRLIRENRLIEIDGNILIGKTPGETALKTRCVLQKASGLVLFIDEAYTLIKGGQECIATLIRSMEDQGDHFVLILAGYPKEMAALLRENPGFRSRIRDYLFFEDFSDSELWEIVLRMAASSYETIPAPAFLAAWPSS